MNKKIKIIDLYNLIANEEKIPKKIKYRGEVYHHNVFKTNYYRDDNGSPLSYVNLNDEAEILENNAEEIEEIQELKKIENGNAYTYNWIEVANKVNELVRAVNQIRKDLNR